MRMSRSETEQGLWKWRPRGKRPGNMSPPFTDQTDLRDGKGYTIVLGYLVPVWMMSLTETG